MSKIIKKPSKKKKKLKRRKGRRAYSFDYVSLFSGIGGFEKALDRNGGNCVLSSDVDKTANISYEALFGEKTSGDIKKVDEKDVPDHELLTGGFPCQSFSLNGKRGGFDDARGTLFFETVRIANEKRPKVMLLENVRGLTSHDKGKTLDTIVKALSDCGYIVDFNIVNSKFFGVPQRRERIYFVAVRSDLVHEEKWNIPDKSSISKAKMRIESYGDVSTFNFNWNDSKEVTTKLEDVMEDNPDESYYFGEDDLPPAIQKISGNQVFVKEATKKGYNVANPGDAVNIQFPKSETRRGRVGRQVSQTLEASTKNQVYVERNGDEVRVRDFTPMECLKLQGFTEEDYDKIVQAGVKPTNIYKQAGNAVTINVVEDLIKRIIPYMKGEYR